MSKLEIKKKAPRATTLKLKLSKFIPSQRSKNKIKRTNNNNNFDKKSETMSSLSFPSNTTEDVINDDNSDDEYEYEYEYDDDDMSSDDDKREDNKEDASKFEIEVEVEASIEGNCNSQVPQT